MRSPKPVDYAASPGCQNKEATSPALFVRAWLRQMWRVGRQEREPSLLMRLAYPTQNKAALAALWCAYALCAYLALAAAEDVGLMAFTRFRHPPQEKFEALRSYNDRRHHLFYDLGAQPGIGFGHCSAAVLC